MQTTASVRARRLVKRFDEVIALDGIDLDVASGQIHGLVGPNGAGKTTLLGLLLGLAVADEGQLEILGWPIRRALSGPDGVSGFVDGPGLYPGLTARGNLAALAGLRSGGAGPSDVDEALAEVGLSDVADDRVRSFSLGMRQRLGVAAALLAKPRLLILDEPSNGLDPAGKRQVHGLLRRLAADGTTVILSSHHMDDLEALCSEVTILVTGRVVFSGPLSKLSTDDRSLDYRLVTSDPAAARELISGRGSVRLVKGSAAGAGGDSNVLAVRARIPELDELVARLVTAGIAVRELAPVVSPLEAAFLALTDEHEDGQ